MRPAALYGVATYGRPSRFIGSGRRSSSRDTAATAGVPADFREAFELPWMRPLCEHAMGSRRPACPFGDGVVAELRGNGPHARIAVKF